MIVGPGLGVVVQATQGSPEERTARNAEHQKFMMEVMGIQRRSGRTYYHEVPEGASSLDTKEARVIRGARGTGK